MPSRPHKTKAPPKPASQRKKSWQVQTQYVNATSDSKETQSTNRGWSLPASGPLRWYEYIPCIVISLALLGLYFYVFRHDIQVYFTQLQAALK